MAQLTKKSTYTRKVWAKWILSMRERILNLSDCWWCVQPCRAWMTQGWKGLQFEIGELFGLWEKLTKTVVSGKFMQLVLRCWFPKAIFAEVIFYEDFTGDECEYVKGDLLSLPYQTRARPGTSTANPRDGLDGDTPERTRHRVYVCVRVLIITVL